MYRKRNLWLKRGFLIGAAAFVFLIIFIARMIHLGPDNQAEEAIDQFYQYEQEGDFSESWSLFHSTMKDRFERGDYIKDRAHVFMNHFGVKTFSYEIGKVEEIKDWKITGESVPIALAYKAEVIQTFKGKYGNFDIHQDVYAIEEEGEWRISWDYNQ
ncbi:hypothetical protein [Bacillus sp. V33-4]|uniref:hypothetical protein n=1 Tax=Bacillus sp. V33-4 TaxID=2054169 RepID=UPI000C78C717|nr:hypothetical protein [Bacillus sp. V33-4]PLR84342.1 hypothetical protein CVD23_11955 [Bacillus sp. V33-4]